MFAKFFVVFLAFSALVGAAPLQSRTPQPGKSANKPKGHPHNNTGHGRRSLISDLEAPVKEIAKTLGLREPSDSQKRGFLSDIEAPFKEIAQKIGLRDESGGPPGFEPIIDQEKRSLISDLEAPVKQIFKTLGLRELSDVHHYETRYHGHHHHTSDEGPPVDQEKRNILSDIEAPFKEIVQKLGLRDESEGLPVIEPAIDQEKRSLISDLEAPVKQIFKTLGLREVSDVHHYDARHHGHHHHGHHHGSNKGNVGQGKRNILSDIEAPFKEIVQKLGLRELADAPENPDNIILDASETPSLSDLN